MFMYDIMCQYIIHLQERISYMLLPSLQIDHAIGMFHVHAHKEQCFFQYSPSLIPSAGVRECHGFVNPCGLVPQVPVGAGMGCEFVTLAQPVPMTWV